MKREDDVWRMLEDNGGAVRYYFRLARDAGTEFRAMWLAAALAAALSDEDFLNSFRAEPCLKYLATSIGIDVPAEFTNETLRVMSAQADAEFRRLREGGSARNYSTVVEFPCECGGQAWVGVEAGNHALFHTMPHCAEFQNMAPDEYLRRNRERIAKGEN